MHSTLQSIHTFDELKDWLGSELDWLVEDFDHEDPVFESAPRESGLGAECAVINTPMPRGSTGPSPTASAIPWSST